MWRVLAFLFTGAWHDCGKYGHEFVARYHGEYGYTDRRKYVRDICTRCGLTVEAEPTLDSIEQ